MYKNFENLRMETERLVERMEEENERQIFAWEKEKLPQLIEGVRHELDGTDFPRKHTYLFPYDGIKGSEDILHRFLCYKRDLEAYQGLDCDVSLVSMRIFCGMYPELSENEIHLQRKYNGWKKKYEFRDTKGTCFSGDTMTSPWTSFRNYLTLLWYALGEQADESLIGKYYGQSGDTLCVPKTCQNDYSGFQSYFLEKCTEDDRSFFEQVIGYIPEKDKLFLYEFLYRCYQAGNFLLIPGYQNDSSFNAGRSNYGRWDTGERLVIGFYRYFKAKEAGRNPGECRRILGDLFTKNKESTVSSCEIWLKALHIETWKNFAEKHLLLGSYVDERTMKPILWRQQEADPIIGIKHGEVSEEDIEYSFENPLPVMPGNLSAISSGGLRRHMDEFLRFWEKTAEKNQIRTEKIAELPL